MRGRLGGGAGVVLGRLRIGYGLRRVMLNHKKLLMVRKLPVLRICVYCTCKLMGNSFS